MSIIGWLARAWNDLEYTLVMWIYRISNRHSYNNYTDHSIWMNQISILNQSNSGPLKTNMPVPQGLL